jgi:hypothetical protein
VAELLDALTLLMNNVGIPTGWRVIQGAPDVPAIRVMPSRNPSTSIRPRSAPA